MICPHDDRECPYGGCSVTLRSRHEFVPASQIVGLETRRAA
jgi:hypothetical protein